MYWESFIGIDFIASAHARPTVTGTTVSMSPCTSMIGILGILLRPSRSTAKAAGASAAAAAHRCGYLIAKYNVPAPPIECPIRYVRSSSTLNSLRIKSTTSSVSLSLSSRRFGGSFGSLSRPGGNVPRRPCGGAASAPAVGPSLAAPRAASTGGARDVAPSLCQVDRVGPHHRQVRAADPVQRHDQWRFLVLLHLRRDEQRVWNLLIGFGEVMHPDLHPRIDRLRPSPPARRLCGGARRGRNGWRGSGGLRDTCVRSDRGNPYARCNGEHVDQSLECHSRHFHMSPLRARSSVNASHSHMS